MVKKLFKHEINYYSRILLPVLGVMLLLSIFLRGLQIFENDSIVYNIVFIFSIFTFVLAVIGCSYITLIMSVIRFYRNLYSCEGYLTFTLPVTSNQHLMVKLFTPLFFQTIASIVISASFFIAMGGDLINEIFKAIVYLLKQINLPAVHMVLYVVEILVLLIISFLSQLFVFYSCISIGQTRKKNRVGFAVIAYIIYIVIIEVISQAITIIFSTMSIFTNFLESIGNFIVSHSILSVHIILLFSLFVATLIGTIGLFINRHILTKKLNLE